MSPVNHPFFNKFLASHGVLSPRLLQHEHLLDLGATSQPQTSDKHFLPHSFLQISYRLICQCESYKTRSWLLDAVSPGGFSYSYTWSFKSTIFLVLNIVSHIKEAVIFLNSYLSYTHDEKRSYLISAIPE